jgi:hypothetical protein
VNATIVSILAVMILSLTGTKNASTRSSEDRQEINALAASWVSAVATRDPAFVDLLSDSGRSYYPKMRDLALHGSATTLQEMELLDQMQVLLLRKMLSPAALQQMDDDVLLRFALAEGFIGMDLRQHDELREIVIDSNRAQGRLYKFGRSDRPDRGLQYFVREEGHWRIDLRGELERRLADFDALVESSGLAASEIAFFLLEMRLMQKIAPADFSAPIAGELGMQKQGPRSPSLTDGERDFGDFRVIAIRHALGSNEPPAVTIEDRVESLRFILSPGEMLPGLPGYRLLRVENKSAVFAGDVGERVLRLHPSGEGLDPSTHLSNSIRRRASKSLFEHALQGAKRSGLMAQWRNIGLRARPQLLQQAWLTPVYSNKTQAGSDMLGLRVQKLVRGSFWQQLGLAGGDLLTHVNDRPIDSMSAWQQVIQIAQTDQSITLTLERAAKQLRYQTQTIAAR